MNIPSGYQARRDILASHYSWQRTMNILYTEKSWLPFQSFLFRSYSLHLALFSNIWIHFLLKLSFPKNSTISSFPKISICLHHYFYLLLPPQICHTTPYPPTSISTGSFSIALKPLTYLMTKCIAFNIFTTSILLL